MNKVTRIAAIVVLYNPESSVLENILTYQNQVDFIYVVDNSIVKNQILLDEIIKLKNIEIIKNPSNIGIAEALNIAAHRAISNGFDFILTMDQDSKATKLMVENLIEKALAIYDLAIISPRHTNVNYKSFNSETDIEEVQIVMTSGNLLSLNAYELVGGFDAELFIDYVDIDLCFKLILNDLKIIRVNSVSIEHQEGNLKTVTCFNWKFRPFNHSPVRWYYKIRNFNYMNNKYSDRFREYFRDEKKRIIKDLMKILFFENTKIAKFSFALKGYLDYKKGIVGKCPHLNH